MKMGMVGNVVAMRLANSWSVLTAATSKSIAYRVRPSDTDGSVALLLRGRRGPHAVLCLPAEEATELARSVELAATNHASLEPSDLAAVDHDGLGFFGRARLAWSVLTGRPRTADVWLVTYLHLKSGTRMVLVDLASRRQPAALARLPLQLADAANLARELEQAVARTAKRRES